MADATKLLRRRLWFDEEDREKILVRARAWFVGIYNSTRKMCESHPYRGFDRTLKSTTKQWDRLGVHEIWFDKTEVEKCIKSDAAGKVLLDITGKDRWLEWMFFPTISHTKGNLLREIVATDPASREKWDRRLKVCGIPWRKAAISEDTIIKITVKLFAEILSEVRTPDSIEGRLRRWKGGPS